MSILDLSFNNTRTIISCCTETGYTFYNVIPGCEKKQNQELNGVGMMKIYKSSNIVLLVGGGANPFKSKDIVVMWDDKKKQSIIEIDMREPVRGILVANDKIISILEKKICIFDWNGSIIGTKVTYANSKGLCVMGERGENVILCMLGSKKGEVAIWKPNNDIYSSIDAHIGNIEALAINNDCSLIATVSETGTLIRVYSVDTLKLEYEFRRGTFGAKINSLCFGKGVLACCSSNGTVHIYELYKDINETKNTQSMLSGLKNYLPSYFGSQWGFKTINISDTSKSICTFDNDNHLYIVTYNGNYYKILADSYETVQENNLYINK